MKRPIARNSAGDFDRVFGIADDDRLAAAQAGLGDRRLVGHAAREAQHVEQRLVLRGVGQHAHAAQRRAERRVVDRDQRVQAGRLVAAARDLLVAVDLDLGDFHRGSRRSFGAVRPAVDGAAPAPPERRARILRHEAVASRRASRASAARLSRRPGCRGSSRVAPLRPSASASHLRRPAEVARVLALRVARAGQELLPPAAASSRPSARRTCRTPRRSPWGFSRSSSGSGFALRHFGKPEQARNGPRREPLIDHRAAALVARDARSSWA